MKYDYVACDLGAESGRVMLGTLDDGRLHLEEIHRFPTGGFRWLGSLRWNLPRIYEELVTGLGKISGVAPAGISVDSWGVDYALFRDDTPLLSLPFHYRDGRTDAFYEATLQQVGREFIFEQTGIQFMGINTLYQLLADAGQTPELLAVAERFLNIGDYLNYLFSGVACAEESLASTTQLYDPKARAWAHGLIRKVGLPEAIFPPVVPSATVLGPLLPEISGPLSLSNPGWLATKVIASCSHDTGCAVAAVPASGEDWAYLSSGTWSLVGCELPAPLMDEAVERADFTNEAGVAGTTRFLKNTAGLWILQECRRTWEQEGERLDYATLVRLAAEAAPLRSLIDPSDPYFLRPDRMPERIALFCRERGQPVPDSLGAFARCIFESLALLYRQTIGQMATLTGRRFHKLHIVGGGSQNALLNQFAANATGLTVLAGPAEATATGNILIQALALGHLPSLAALRQVVGDSVTPAAFEPQESPLWETAYSRFLNLRKSS